MNIKKLIFFSLFVVVAGGVFAQLIAQPAATVNYSKPEMISVKQLENQVGVITALKQRAGQPAAAAGKAQKLEVLDMMISDILIMQAAESEGVVAESAEIDAAVANQKSQIEKANGRAVTDAQFRLAIENQTGYNWNEYRAQLSKQIIQQKFLMLKKQAAIESYIKMPDYKDIEWFYIQNKTKFTNPEMIRYSQIFIGTVNLNPQQIQDAGKKAEEAYRKYVNGSASFEQLVNEYTEDQNAKYRNGDSGYLAFGDPNAAAYLGQDFMMKLYNLKEGDVSAVIRSNVGYHIIKVTEYLEGKTLTLDDKIHPTVNQTVREYIAQQLIMGSQQQALARALNELVEELKSKADIKIFEENIN